MHAFPWLDQFWYTHLAATLIHFLWQGLAIGLAAWFCNALLRNARPRTRYNMHLGALLLMAICPLATSRHPGMMRLANCQPNVLVAARTAIRQLAIVTVGNTATNSAK